MLPIFSMKFNGYCSGGASVSARMPYRCTALHEPQQPVRPPSQGCAGYKVTIHSGKNKGCNLWYAQDKGASRSGIATGDSDRSTQNTPVPQGDYSGADSGTGGLLNGVRASRSTSGIRTARRLSWCTITMVQYPSPCRWPSVVALTRKLSVSEALPNLPTHISTRTRSSSKIGEANSQWKFARRGQAFHASNVGGI